MGDVGDQVGLDLIQLGESFKRAAQLGGSLGDASLEVAIGFLQGGVQLDDLVVDGTIQRASIDETELDHGLAQESVFTL